MWIAFLLLHLVGLVGYNLLLRKSIVEKVDKWTLATLMQTGIALPLLILAPFKFPDFSIFTPATIAHMFITASLIVLLHLSNVKSLQYLEAGVYSVLYNLRIIFTTILGVIFLNEQLIPLQIIGGLLIFASVVAVKQKGRRDLTVKGIQWGLFASLVISVLNLNEKQLIAQFGFTGYAIPVMILAAIMMWIIFFTRGQRIKPSVFIEPRMMSLMALRAISAFGFTLAFSAGGLLSVSTYISSLGVIIIVILGAVLLGEKDYLKRKIIASVIAFAGLTCIFVANLLR